MYAGECCHCAGFMYAGECCHWEICWNPFWYSVAGYPKTVFARNVTKMPTRLELIVIKKSQDWSVTPQTPVTALPPFVITPNITSISSLLFLLTTCGGTEIQNFRIFYERLGGYKYDHELDSRYSLLRTCCRPAIFCQVGPSEITLRRKLEVSLISLDTKFIIRVVLGFSYSCCNSWNEDSHLEVWMMNNDQNDDWWVSHHYGT